MSQKPDIWTAAPNSEQFPSSQSSGQGACATVLLFRLDDDDIGVVPRAIEKDALAI